MNAYNASLAQPNHTKMSPETLMKSNQSEKTDLVLQTMVYALGPRNNKLPSKQAIEFSPWRLSD